MYGWDYPLLTFIYSGFLESKGGSTYPLVHTPWLPRFPTHFVEGKTRFWGEGYEHQEAFWVHLSKGYVKGVCTSNHGLRVLLCWGWFQGKPEGKPSCVSSEVGLKGNQTECILRFPYFVTHTCVFCLLVFQKERLEMFSSCGGSPVVAGGLNPKNKYPFSLGEGGHLLSFGLGTYSFICSSPLEKYNVQ